MLCYDKNRKGKRKEKGKQEAGKKREDSTKMVTDGYK